MVAPTESIYNKDNAMQVTTSWYQSLFYRKSSNMERKSLNIQPCAPKSRLTAAIHNRMHRHLLVHATVAAAARVMLLLAVGRFRLIGLECCMRHTWLC